MSRASDLHDRAAEPVAGHSVWFEPGDGAGCSVSTGPSRACRRDRAARSSRRANGAATVRTDAACSACVLADPERAAGFVGSAASRILVHASAAGRARACARPSPSPIRAAVRGAGGRGERCARDRPDVAPSDEQYSGLPTCRRNRVVGMARLHHGRTGEAADQVPGWLSVGHFRHAGGVLSDAVRQ